MTTVLLFLAEVTFVFALALLVVRLAAGARAAVRHLILASAFGVVLVLPLATLVSPPVAVIPAPPAYAVEPVAVTPIVAAPVERGPRSTDDIPAARTELAAIHARPVPVATWALLIWAVVALVALVPVGASIAYVRSIRRIGRPWPEGTARMHDIAHASGMRPPTLLLHDAVAGPIIGGVLLPVVILPASAVTWSEPHVDNALVHELEHVRRRDWPVHLTSRAVCALCWFHPLAWIAWRRLRLEAERACDDAVLAREDAASYAEQLLQLARLPTHQPAHGLSMATDSDLKTRIRSVLDNVRPRGRAGKVMIACTALAAAVALAALAPLRFFEDLELQMRSAADLLAKRADADSLAAAAVLSLNSEMSRSDKDWAQPLVLVWEASLMAPERADLLWLRIQFCDRFVFCDPEPLESQLRSLDGSNGAGWFGALARARKRGDAEAMAAALVAIGRSERVDMYWTTLVSRLSRQVASTKAMSLHDAKISVIGATAALPIPGMLEVTDACTEERLRVTRIAELAVCRGVADSFLHGDTYIIESAGASLAMRSWPENSPRWVEAAEMQHTFKHRVRFAEAAMEWIEDHPSEHLALFEQYRREQDADKAVMIAIGKSPNPAPSE